jgi:Arc/MetJ-type ribon-helix-helix transcriptional regulator
MVYLPPELLDELDELVLRGKRSHGRHVNRSAVVQACVKLALRTGGDTILDSIA